MIGCEGDIISPNSEGIFAFNIGTTEFTYTPGTRTGTMVVFNPTSIETWLNIKIADGWEGRRGVSMTLRAHRGGSYDEYYTWGEELRIVIHRDGIETINYIFLGSGDNPNGSGKIVVIVENTDNITSIVEWFNSQDWSTYYSAGGEKTDITIRTADKQLINAVLSGEASIGNNNANVVVEKVSLKSGVCDDIKDAGIETNNTGQADYMEIKISVNSF